MHTAPGGREIVTVPAYVHGERLDAFLTKSVGGRSRSDWQRLVELDLIKVNGRSAKPSTRVWPNEHVSIDPVAPHATLRAATEIPIDIIYEDPAMVVVNKPPGLVVHPAPGHESDTLVNALLARFPELQDPTGELRPGIVHRLDKDTSGLIVIGRTIQAVAELQRQMKDRTSVKRYHVLVNGVIHEDEAVIDAPIGRDTRDRQKMSIRADAREAVTRFRVTERFEDYTLVDATLETGRTHQLRVHFAFIGHGVAADGTYGSGRRPAGLHRQFVHAHYLKLISPDSGQLVELDIPLAADLQACIDELHRQQQKLEARRG
ncbi:MAG TPA: RluA family pseudouridine synthase [Chloroflexota bacterium]|jgi:23S rRNA pseudouridine1911/1915/1917 synthase|nr:RluA family pseudouridine synthase [Chloroflexota bacterium]